MPVETPEEASKFVRRWMNDRRVFNAIPAIKVKRCFFRMKAHLGTGLTSPYNNQKTW